jgi:hypothetical protein
MIANNAAKALAHRIRHLDCVKTANSPPTTPTTERPSCRHARKAFLSRAGGPLWRETHPVTRRHRLTKVAAELAEQAIAVALGTDTAPIAPDCWRQLRLSSAGIPLRVRRRSVGRRWAARFRRSAGR